MKRFRRRLGRGIFLAWALVISCLPVAAYYIVTDSSRVYAVVWPEGNIPLEVKLTTSSTLSDGTNLASSFVAAAQTWNGVVGAVQFAPTVTTPGSYSLLNGTNEVVMDSSIEGDAFGTYTLAVTVSYRSGNERIESDIIFNTAWTWDSYRGDLRSGPQDLRRVAIHELGHALGLLHPDQASPAQSVTAIMNSTVSDLDGLQADDIAGAQWLYGAPGIRPNNDDFLNATAVVHGANATTVYGTNIAATVEAGEPQHAGNAVDQTVWWTWTPASSGAISVTTLGSNFDTVLGVYTGSAVNSLSLVTSNDDVTLGEVRTSIVNFEAVGGTPYRIAVGGWDGSFGQISLNFSPLVPPGFPRIVQQPENLSVGAGANATFTVGAVGDAPLSYQWQHYVDSSWQNLVDGSSVSGSQSSALTLLGVSTDLSNRAYRVVVGNSLGSVHSSSAQLIVSDAIPVITSLSPDQSLEQGDLLSLTVEAVGSYVMSYQWYLDGEPILSADGQRSTYTLFSAQPVHAGEYQVRVSSYLGEVYSDVITVTVATGPGAVKVAAGGSHAFFIRQDGTLFGSGEQFRKQLGNGSGRMNFLYPHPSFGGVAEVVAGDYYSYVIKDDHTLWGFGLNNSGGLGPDGVTSFLDPVQLYTNVNSITPFGYFVTREGELWRMGGTSGPNPRFFVSDVYQVGIGYMSIVYLDGAGDLWQLNLGYSQEVLAPTLVASDVVKINSYGSLLLLIKTDGQAWIWGYDGVSTYRTPTQVGLSAVVDVAAGQNHCLFLRADGTLWTSGSNSNGQLGDGTLTSTSTPKQVATGVFAIAAGDRNSRFIKTDGSVWAMGRNVGGILGDGSTIDRSTPVWIADGPISLPSQTTNLSATYVEDINRVRLTWDRTAGASFYEVWRSASNDFSSAVRLRDRVQGTVFLDGTGNYGSTYYYWIRPISPQGSGSPSEAAVETVLPVSGADLNGDGQLDIVWRNSTSGEVGVWLMNRTSVGTYQAISTMSTDYVLSGTGDFNADDQTDILWRHSASGEVGVWLMDGTSVGSYQAIYTLGREYVLSGTGDFNADGQTDILLRNRATGDVGVWLMNGTSISSYQVLGTVSADYVLSGTGDFNVDGQPDILWRHRASGEVGVWLMNGTSVGSYQAIHALDRNYVLCGTGDYNEDGRTDILLRHSPSGEAGVWLMNGTSVSSYQVISTVNTDYVLANNGEPTTSTPRLDLNDDGQTDVLWRNSSTGQVIVWLMDDTDLTTYAELPTTDLNYRLSGWGDFTGDGEEDLLWRHSGGEVGLWTMEGTSVTGYTVLGWVPMDYTLCGVGDFNTDGYPDILWRHSSGELGVWLMNGTTVSSYQMISNVNTDYTFSGTGDFNGDGYTDILWRHTPTGEVGTWLMEGTSILRYESIGSVDPSYTITGIGDYNADGDADILWRHSSGELGVWLMSGYVPAVYEYIDSVAPAWSVTQ